MPEGTIDYAAGSQRASQAWLVCGVAACCIAAIAIIAPIPSIANVASYPPGTSMPPMGAVRKLFVGGAAGLFDVVPLSLVCLIQARRRRAGLVLGAVALLLGAVAAFGNSYAFHHVVASRGYVMEP